MGNNDNELGIKEVHVRISEIIYSMSKAKRRKLLKGLEKWQQSTLSDNKLSIKEVYAGIFEIIDSMSEAEKRKLLKGLQKWQQLFDKRKHSRKLTSIYAICETKNRYFRDLIKNISAGGLFIKTGIPLSINQELFITFSPLDSGVPIKITGEIVRRDPEGIGVKLYDTIPEI